MAETIVLQSSLFNSESLQQDIGFSVNHLESRWQIGLDELFTEIFLDSWFVTAPLDELIISLEPDEYYIRVQYRDNYGIISEWSDPIFILVEAPPIPEPDECTVHIPVYEEANEAPIQAFVREGCGTNVTHLNDENEGFPIPHKIC